MKIIRLLFLLLTLILIISCSNGSQQEEEVISTQVNNIDEIERIEEDQKYREFNEQYPQRLEEALSGLRASGAKNIKVHEGGFETLIGFTGSAGQKDTFKVVVEARVGDFIGDGILFPRE